MRPSEALVKVYSADYVFSPDDQTILEEAYIRDCKPDKEARQALVKRVALGEKEVQVRS